MSKEKAFIEKILLDAKEQTEEIKLNAKNQAKENTKLKKAQEKQFFKAEKNSIEEELEKQLENAQSSSYIEQSKDILSAKQQILKEIFDAVLQKLKKLPAKTYQEFLQGVLTKCANTQDGLIVSSRAGEAEKIQKLPIFKKKKLKILETSKQISGGVIIVSSTCEQDFSFEGLVDEKFRTSAYQISKQLF